MRKILLILCLLLSVFVSHAQIKAYTIEGTVSLTADSLLVINGDTIGHFHSLGTDTVVDKSYIDALFTGTYVEFSDSIITFVTPAQLSDSLNSLPEGHDAVTLAASATNGGLSLSGQQIGFQAASTSQAGYLTSANFNIFNNKLSFVSHDATLSGNGTSGSPLSADTSVVTLKTWVEDQEYITSVYLHYDSLSGTPTIPEISNIAYGSEWDDNLDGASKNALYDIIETLGETKYFEKELSDSENNINVGFTLNSKCAVFFNGQALPQTVWNGEGTATLSLNLDIKVYDKLIVKQ